MEENAELSKEPSQTVGDQGLGFCHKRSSLLQIYPACSELSSLDLQANYTFIVVGHSFDFSHLRIRCLPQSIFRKKP